MSRWGVSRLRWRAGDVRPEGAPRADGLAAATDTPDHRLEPLGQPTRIPPMDVAEGDPAGAKRRGGSAPPRRRRAVERSETKRLRSGSSPEPTFTTPPTRCPHSA